MTVVEWINSTGRGWIFDSLVPGNVEFKAHIKTLLDEIFMRNSNLLWMEERSTAQTELECGPRTIWAMAVTLSGRTQNRTMEEIRTAIHNLRENNRRLDSSRVRQTVRNSLVNFREWMTSNGIWSGNQDIP